MSKVGQKSDSNVSRRHILPSEVGPRAVRVEDWCVLGLFGDVPTIDGHVVRPGIATHQCLSVLVFKYISYFNDQIKRNNIDMFVWLDGHMLSPGYGSMMNIYLAYLGFFSIEHYGYPIHV